MIQAAMSVTALVTALGDGWLESGNAGDPIPPTGEDKRPALHPSSSCSDGALSALRLAAIKARRRAIAPDGYVATWRDGKIEYDTKP